MSEPPVIGSKVYAKPPHQCIIAGRPDEGVIIALNETANHGRIVTLELPDHEERRVWWKDFTYDPPDPHALFRDHYL